MIKNKKTTTNDIVSNYMQYVIENNSKPESVNEFAVAYKFDDSIFFNDFEDFEAVSYTHLTLPTTPYV